ncbi:MAG: hypothetical protein J7L77_09565 [Clostridiales bacterium]|nr:hypothetical protein [Clostridiales bacterium]
MMEKVLATIDSANLDILDRDILTFWITVTYEDSGNSQGIGGFALDEYCNIKKRRVGTAYGCEMIIRLLKLFKVNSLHEAIGKSVYILGDGDGLRFKPRGIQTLRKDGARELIFTDVANDML